MKQKAKAVDTGGTSTLTVNTDVDKRCPVLHLKAAVHAA
jgi:hypothetical protein